jgi:hypothetical protein
VFSCIFSVRFEGESEEHLSAHVAVTVAVAAVAFPLAADGVFLTAAMAITGWDVENGNRHSELRRRVRMAARLGCDRSIVERNKNCRKTK